MNFTQSLFWKILFIFSLLIGLIGISFTMFSVYQANQFFNQTNQHLHYNLANYLIEERFSSASPFLEDGNVNKALFGDIMHDMMAVNRNIEVYLLDEVGMVRYCVVLDEFNFEENQLQVDLAPIRSFIDAETRSENQMLMGDDPRNPKDKKVFSAASLEKLGHDGYIYIVLSGKDYEAAKANLMGPHFLTLGKQVISISILSALLLGSLLIWYLMKRLRKIVYVMNQFEQGDYQARIQLKSSGELTYLANQFNRMADKVVQSMNEIKDTEKLRRELVANISHDLRTPLAIIFGYVETFKEKKDKLSPEEKSKFFEHIASNVKKLKRLVEELFELSKLEAKQVALNKEPIYINEIIYDNIEEYKLIAAEKNIQISTNFSFEKSSIVVMADLNLINRVLQNLLDNAIRFTNAGGEVYINAIQNGEKVAIQVKDTGVGISKTELPNIFKRYYTRTDSNKKNGTGLGLAIAKHIIELHDSTFKVYSEINRGSQFSFELPVF